MNEHDQELIVDLIDGRLSSQEERAALARLETDAEFRSEYEAQRAMSSLLADAPIPAMTSDERTLLHASLKRELHLEPAAAAAVPARASRWQRWLAPIGSLAAAAAVLAGIFVVLPQSANDSAEMAMDATTTSAPAAEALDGRAADEDAGGAPETTSAATFEESAPPAEAPTETGADNAAVGRAVFSVPHVPDIDIQRFAASPEATKQLVQSDAVGDGAEADEPDARIADCLDALRSDPGFSSVEPIVTTTHTGADALVVEIALTDGDPYYAAYALDTCLELESTRG